ncbi:MAG: hypothetical protein AB1742_02830 [bacterium]
MKTALTLKDLEEWLGRLSRLKELMESLARTVEGGWNAEEVRASFAGVQREFEDIKKLAGRAEGALRTGSPDEERRAAETLDRIRAAGEQVGKQYESLMKEIGGKRAESLEKLKTIRKGKEMVERFADKSWGGEPKFFDRRG